MGDNWIDIKNAWPAPDCPVIAVALGFMCMGYIKKDSDKNSFNFHEALSDKKIFDGVEYWQPRPAFPEGL